MAYEFYLDDGCGGADLIGILPERRKDPLRITRERIVNSMVVLESEDGQGQLLIEVENLNLFYKKKGLVRAENKILNMERELCAKSFFGCVYLV